ncbi:hypothetical protein CBER1_00841 [Cercospora berteroae]|uniref:HECT-type E3 ubiquitin transferase n=1 Tax=Cercospora berteroae TaxID=357750 RepID=A0A2S6C1L3_9PEZI|nr:hypothetical protein CBER1_00841 [Cercospora berteroae]
MTLHPNEQPGKQGVEAAQELIPRYEAQLLNGCGNEHCTEILCHTGRLNTSGQPVRRYTARSARTIAMAVCSGPKPRARLCPHYTSTTSGQQPAAAEPRDPSALMQLLADTNARVSMEGSSRAGGMDLSTLHRQLDPLISGASMGSDDEFMDKLLPCIDNLLNLIPAHRAALWEMIDREIVSKGFLCPVKKETKPADENWNAWVAILDFLDDEAHLRLLRRTLLAIGHRHRSSCAREESQSCNGSVFIIKFTVLLMNKIQEHASSPLSVIVWLKSMFARAWDGSQILASGSVAHAILEILDRLNIYCANVSRDVFQMPFVCMRVAELDMAESFRSHTPDAGQHILNYQYLFSPSQLILSFRAVNLLAMSRANAQVARTSDFRRRHSRNRSLELDSQSAQLQHQEERYLLLYISREDMIKDTFNQLWQRRTDEMHRPLRVRMGADELDIGHDLGGVQIEFLNMICKHIFAEEAQMFTTDPQTGLSFFRAGSLQPTYMFELFGLLMALAIYNGITLPVRLPSMFYYILCGSEHDLMLAHDPLIMIQDAWPTVARSLRSLRTEYVEDLEFAFPLEANGIRLSCLPLTGETNSSLHDRLKLRVVSSSLSSRSSVRPSIDMNQLRHAWPGWDIVESEEKPEPVAPENIERYLAAYSTWLCYHSVRPQIQAFAHGFRTSQLLNRTTLSILGPSLLKSYVEGTDVLDIADLKAAARYDGYDERLKYIQAFWRIVAAWPQEKQKLLLKFVTAAERIPIGGAGHLTFIIKRSQPNDPNALPTSSTCFGTLMLPRYQSHEILAAKLDIALKFGAEGFGTG